MLRDEKPSLGPPQTSWSCLSYESSRKMPSGTQPNGQLSIKSVNAAAERKGYGTTTIRDINSITTVVKNTNAGNNREKIVQAQKAALELLDEAEAFLEDEDEAFKQDASSSTLNSSFSKGIGKMLTDMCMSGSSNNSSRKSRRRRSSTKQQQQPSQTRVVSGSGDGSSKPRRSRSYGSLKEMANGSRRLSLSSDGSSSRRRRSKSSSGSSKLRESTSTRKGPPRRRKSFSGISHEGEGTPTGKSLKEALSFLGVIAAGTNFEGPEDGFIYQTMHHAAPPKDTTVECRCLEPGQPNQTFSAEDVFFWSTAYM